MILMTDLIGLAIKTDEELVNRFKLISKSQIMKIYLEDIEQHKNYYREQSEMVISEDDRVVLRFVSSN
jgi:DNA-directed RNA polymerase subunit E'/Rpb7